MPESVQIEGESFAEPELENLVSVDLQSQAGDDDKNDKGNDNNNSSDKPKDGDEGEEGGGTSGAGRTKTTPSWNVKNTNGNTSEANKVCRSLSQPALLTITSLSFHSFFFLCRMRSPLFVSATANSHVSLAYCE